MQQISEETSEDPDWLKQVSLSVLVGVGPYFVHAASAHHAPSMVVHSARATSTVPKSLRLGTQTSMVQPNPAVAIGPSMLPSYPIPDTHVVPSVPVSGTRALHVQISQQIAPVPQVVQLQVRTYSYAKVSFTWQPGQVVTFQSLPAVWSCITMNESSDMVQRSNPKSSAQGAFQIKSLMWAKYKLPDYPDTPNQATLEQQYHVALRIFRADGFAEWETAPLCGV